VLELSLADGTVVDSITLAPDSRGSFDVDNMGVCTRLVPQFEPGVTYCGRVIAYDLAGNATPSGQRVCQVTSECTNTQTASCTAANACAGSTLPPSGGVPTREPPDSAGCRPGSAAPAR
jgi:hypothetical protein